MNRTPSSQGFTLVELSIVLVILGLLVGGVLSGQSLIRASELRAVVTERDKYTTAFNAFRDKYFAFPGDMKNAVKFWGAADGGTDDGIDTDCLPAAGTGTQTCNGNGNGIVGLAETNLGIGSSEAFRVWQHLANAGLVEGTFTGIEDPDSDSGYAIGSDIPASRLTSAGWRVDNLGAGGGKYFTSRFGNDLFFGAFNSRSTDPAIKAEEAYNIDTKVDDGKPQSGTVLAMLINHYMPNCATADDDAYDVANTTAQACALIFKTGS